MCTSKVNHRFEISIPFERKLTFELNETTEYTQRPKINAVSIEELNEIGKNEIGVDNPDAKCHTMLDDIVGAIAASASTRIAQVMNEELANEDPSYEKISIFDL